MNSIDELLKKKRPKVATGSSITADLARIPASAFAKYSNPDECFSSFSCHVFQFMTSKERRRGNHQTHRQ